MPRVTSPWHPVFVCLLLVGLSGVLVGCNVFGGQTGSAETVPELLADARIALTKGETGRAVSLLEAAHDLDSTHVGVRVELSNALFADRGYDVFLLREALHAFTQYKPQKGASEKRAVCSGERAPDSVAAQYNAVDVGEGSSIQAVMGQTTVINRVRNLLLRGVFEVRGERLAARDNRSRMKAYLLGTLAKAGFGVQEMARELTSTEASLYYGEGSSVGQFVACAKSREGLDRVETSLCAYQERLAQSVDWLDRRNQLVGSERESVLLSPMRKQSDALVAGLACSE